MRVGCLWTVTLVACTVVVARGAQRARDTDVYLAPLLDGGLGTIEDISRNPGYDNQPAFVADGKAVLFASDVDGLQTDVYRYDIKSRRLTRVTKTPESEYLPRSSPDGKSITALRLGQGGAQQLWQFRNDGSRPVRLFPDVTSVSAYAWIDAKQIALAVVDARRGTALEIGHPNGDSPEVVATNVGRSLEFQAKLGLLAFVATAPAGRRDVINAMDARTKAIHALVAKPRGAGDFAWMPNGDLLIVQSAAIDRWSSGRTDWTHFADVPPRTCTNVTHLAVSLDGRWLAFVAEPVAR